jgi:hypothetical protein
MPHDGAIPLGEYPFEEVQLRCERCGREALYPKAALVELGAGGLRFRHSGSR